MDNRLCTLLNVGTKTGRQSLPCQDQGPARGKMPPSKGGKGSLPPKCFYTDLYSNSGDVRLIIPPLFSSAYFNSSPIWLWNWNKHFNDSIVHRTQSPGRHLSYITISLCDSITTYLRSIIWYDAWRLRRRGVERRRPICELNIHEHISILPTAWLNHENFAP